MSSIIIGLFLFALDTTILADVQPKIATEFDAVNRVAWLAVALMIPSLGLMLPNGQIFQTFNVKWLYIAGVVTFEIGSALCGAAPTMTFLIFARAIAGVGCTLIYTGSLVLITINTTERERYPSQLQR
jgi:MFS family permease